MSPVCILCGNRTECHANIPRNIIQGAVGWAKEALIPFLNYAIGGMRDPKTCLMIMNKYMPQEGIEPGSVEDWLLLEFASVS